MMAIYVPASRRRRTVLLAAAAALVIGLGIGLLIGRGTVESVGDRVSRVQNDARSTSASLRVLSLHEQAGVATASGNDIAAVLRRVRTELINEFDRAPWIGAETRRSLLVQLGRLGHVADPSSVVFGTGAERLADSIDTAFGVR